MFSSVHPVHVKKMAVFHPGKVCFHEKSRDKIDHQSKGAIQYAGSGPARESEKRREY